MLGRVVVAGLALAATGALSVACAQDKWIPIGSKDVDTSRGFDSIDLKGARGSFKAFRVLVQSGELTEVSNIQVRYSNGLAHSETRLQSKTIRLGTGERTRVIDQRDTERFADGVTLCFKSGRGPAKVEVQGLQSSRGASGVRPAVTQALSWPAACPGAPAVTVAAPAGPSAPPAVPSPSGASSANAAPATGPLAGTSTAPIPNTAAVGSASGPGGAVLFGVQNVGFLRDRDVIKVGSNLGQFDRLQLRVLDNDIYMNDLDVIYADGTTQKLVVGSDVKQNTRTRWLDLKGDKFIKEVQMTYRSRPSLKNGQARIEVYGQYAEGWLGPNGRGRQFNEGWVLVGAQTAGRFLRTETDVIPICRNEGKFKRIRVTVKDRALVFDEMRVVYNNNEEELIPVKATVAANSTWGPVDLKAGDRGIKEIRAKYRSAVIDAKAVGRGASVVEIWCQH